MSRGLAAVPCVLLALGCLAQEPTTLRTGTQIVMVDVTVTDSHGAAIHNLKQTDFTVLEDGSPQTIAHFEEHAGPTAVAPATQIPKLEPNTYTNFTLAPQDGPSSLLLIDTLNTPVNDQAAARQKLIAFIKGLRPDTRLAVFALSTRLTLLQSFTSDPKLLLAAVSNNANVQGSPILPDAIGTEAISDIVRVPSPQTMDTMRQGEATHTAQQNRLRVLTTLSAMNQLARYLAGVPGRKNLIWISGSFPLSFLPNARVKNSFGPTDNFQADIRETTNLLARSQVAIYPIDARGIQNTPLTDVSAGKYVYGSNKLQGDIETFSIQNIDDQNTMRRLAESTGGKPYLNTSDLGGAVQKAIDNGSSYYTLVYNPANRDKPGYRKIAVHLASSGYNLAHRDGYYVDEAGSKPASANDDRKPSTPAPIDPMRLAMQRGAPTPTQILLKALFVADSKSSSKPAEGNVASAQSRPPYHIITIAYAANPGDINMPARPDGLRHVDLDFVALVYDRDGQLFTQQTNRVNVFAGPQAVQDFMKEGVRYQQQIAVPAKGEYYLRTGIHDLIGNTIGAIEIPIAAVQPAAK